MLVDEAVPLIATPLFLAAGGLLPEFCCSESSSSRIKGSSFRSFTVNSTLFGWKETHSSSTQSLHYVKLARTFPSLSLPAH